MGEAAEAFRSTTNARFSLEIQNGEHIDADQLWTHLAKGMRDTAKAVLGETRGTGSQRKGGRESWWISEEVKPRLRQNLVALKNLSRASKTGQMRTGPWLGRDTTKPRKRQRRLDLGDVIYIKDESGRSIVKVEDIRKRWEEYFANLFNRRESGRSEGGIDHGTHSDICCDDDDTPRISQEEVRLTLKKMRRNKATGPDQIPIEAWRCLGDVGISLLTSLFNKIWTSAKMLEEWRLSEVIPIYKNKGDVQSCSNYRETETLNKMLQR
uniref:uncharacterized protein LOC122583425 n=1 Tax=Erigeron canadensis TaxID=72917 RepID=UPI001CB8FCAF|nr:uncharacterized protein LOC122583425 [Erigeron canadensis]